MDNKIAHYHDKLTEEAVFFVPKYKILYTGLGMSMYVL